MVTAVYVSASEHINNGAKKESKSLAKMIMMRESLAGLPKESLGGLFRQSLSLAELDRLFEDDSTQSFENLECRLKTPMRKALKKSICVNKDILEANKTVENDNIQVRFSEYANDKTNSPYTSENNDHVNDQQKASEYINSDNN